MKLNPYEEPIPLDVERDIQLSATEISTMPKFQRRDSIVRELRSAFQLGFGCAVEGMIRELAEDSRRKTVRKGKTGRPR